MQDILDKFDNLSISLKDICVNDLEDSSKTLSINVLETDLEDSSKTLSIDVLETDLEDSSKTLSIDVLETDLEDSSKIINKGTGAGGSKTNFNGKNFEKKFSFENILAEKHGFTKIEKEKYHYYYKKFDEKEILHFTQQNFRKYFKQVYDIEFFNLPDEAYLINYFNGTKELKILEMKNQNCEGSVEQKLLCGNSIKKIYEKIIEKKFDSLKKINPFKLYYAFSISKFLSEKFDKKDKYKLWKEIIEEDDIIIFHPEYDDFFIEKIEKWLFF